MGDVLDADSVQRLVRIEAERMAKSTEPITAEIGNALLAGHVTLRDLVTSDVYRDYLEPRATAAVEEFNAMSAEERSQAVRADVDEIRRLLQFTERHDPRPEAQPDHEEEDFEFRRYLR